MVCACIQCHIYFNKFIERMASSLGVPKLNRPELETACEDFSNIITTEDGIATVYKGTLSSGVEISVASTAICALKDWSKRSESVFRKKVSRCLGYCVKK